jgi:hypothetical protein
MSTVPQYECNFFSNGITIQTHGFPLDNNSHWIIDISKGIIPRYILKIPRYS